nr:hypothetical protein [Tanacetum cinerariifolium]
MADVRRLSAHVIKLRDMHKVVLVLFGLSHVWKNRVCDLMLWGADGNVMGIHDYLCLPEWTSSEVQKEPHLDVRPTLKRLPFYCTPPAAADRKASISGATLSHVAKRTRSALAQSSGSTTRPSLFMGDDDESNDDDDACIEILLVNPLRSAVVIPSSGNQGGSFVASAAEGSNTRDSRGKGVMVDDVVAPSAGVSRPRPSFEPASSFRDISGDAIHTDFFPFFAGPYYDTYPKDVLLGNEVFKNPAVCKTIVDQFLTPREMVRVESLLKGYDEKVANMTGLELQVSALKKQVSRLNDKLSFFDASFIKSKAKGKERKKKIKSLTKSLDNLHTEVARFSAALNQETILEAEWDEEILRLKTTPLEFSSFFRGQFQGLGELLSLAASAGFERGLSMHQTKDEFVVVLKKMVNFMPGAHDRLAEAYLLVAQTDYAFLNNLSEHDVEPLSVILQLKPKNLVRSANVPTLLDACVSLSVAKESTVTPDSKSLELSANVDLTASVVASKHNEEMVSAEVDGSNPKMIDDTITAKSGHAFMQGMSFVLNDVVDLAGVGSGRVSSGANDVVVALSFGEKGDGLTPSFVTGEKAAVNPSGFRFSLSPSFSFFLFL